MLMSEDKEILERIKRVETMVSRAYKLARLVRRRHNQVTDAFNNNFIHGNSSSNYSVYISCAYSILDGNIITGSASELYYAGTSNITGDNNLL